MTNVSLVKKWFRPAILGSWALLALVVAASAQDPAPAADVPPLSTTQESPAAPAEAATTAPNDHAAGEHAAEGDHHGDEEHHGEPLGKIMPKWSVIPFALLLLCIAVFPLVEPHWWEHNSNKGIIVALLAIPTFLYVWSYGHEGHHALQHAGEEYVSFLVLLGSLFAISGGIYIRGAFVGSPWVNFLFMAIGTAIASIVGTTGASMLLIRPLLRANAHRTRVAHIVVFFIFTVSNCGGLLTPLGDPPLFLGFLKGVPFEWTLRLYPQWIVVNSILLALFYIVDAIMLAREPKSETPFVPGTEKFGIEGAHNLVFLAGVILVICLSGQGVFNYAKDRSFGVPEGIMLLLTVVSFAMTSGALREKNRFSFGPILEVAVLFSGIFVTMIPALAILNVEGKNLGITTEWQFFWASGILSSFLDNAPTYLAFAATAAGMAGVSTDGAYLKNYLASGADAQAILAAISCGSVFMGANTYIGNGPNFMVKAIAEENNVKMPSFFGYMAYSVSILIPIFILVTVIFFG